VVVPADVEEPLRVLFVCTANISRSPYAERRAAQLLAETGGDPVTVASAGIPGVPGRDMDQRMAAQLRARGGEPNGHVSRAVTHDLLVSSELVLTFELAHKVRLTTTWPDQAIKVFGLRQFADALARVPSPGRGLELLDQVYAASRPDGLNADFPDPYRRGTAAARESAAAIDAVLERIIPALAGRGRAR
jgi:protein-tyrosine-phosphatase